MDREQRLRRVRWKNIFNVHWVRGEDPPDRQIAYGYTVPGAEDYPPDAALRCLRPRWYRRNCADCEAGDDWCCAL